MKIVMVLNNEMPAGQAVNATAMLGASMSPHLFETLGPDVKDAAGDNHAGLLRLPIPVLSASGDKLSEIHRASKARNSLKCEAFSDIAQKSRTYEEYAEKMAEAGGKNICYLGLCLYGDEKDVSKLTGSLPLFR